MTKSLTLKYDPLENWPDFLEENSYSPTCQVVCKNGKGKVNTIILAAISPFLKDLLSSLPPYIEGCIMLPDIEWIDFSQFLESLSQSNENFTVTKSLVTLLGIKLDHFNDATIRNVVKEEFVESLELMNDANNINYEDTNGCVVKIEPFKSNTTDHNNQDVFNPIFDRCNYSDEKINFGFQENFSDETNDNNKMTYFTDDKEMLSEDGDFLINKNASGKRIASNLSQLYENENIAKKMRIIPSVHKEFEEQKGNYGRSGGFSKCKHCSKIYNHRNCSGLMIHLKRKHPKIYQQCQEEDSKMKDYKIKLRMVQHQNERDGLGDKEIFEDVFDPIFADNLSESQDIAKKMRIGNASVHKEFEEMKGNDGKTNGGTSKCKHCPKIYNHRNCTGLMQHLKNKHPKIYEQCQEEDLKIKNYKIKLRMVQLQNTDVMEPKF